MSIGEGNDRPDGRRGSVAAQIMVAAALGIMLVALLLAAASVHAAAAALQLPEPVAAQPTQPALMLRDPGGKLITLGSEKSETVADVNPATARILVRHRFQAGPGDLRDGVVLLPLPADGRPQRVRLAIGPRRVEVDLTMGAGEEGAELLALPVLGVGAHAEVRVELTYTRPVVLGENRFVVALPLTPLDGARPRLGAASWQQSLAGPPPIAVELDPGLPIAELRSPTHGIDIARGAGERRRIVLADPDPVDGRDFVLVWSPADPSAPLGALRRYFAHKTAVAAPDGEGAVALKQRKLGKIRTLAPVSDGAAQVLEGGGILSLLAARSTSGTDSLGGAVAPVPLVIALLLLWAAGAVYLVTRRGKGI